ncbi:ferrochelatase, mitochondrial isoform X2 [Bombyx mori]|uniref:ferrochelatase, mitochondrial isoform X2 n=1 Tax=Bombyx mori TaxID=7091 RepID=UPI002ED3245D
MMSKIHRFNSMILPRLPPAFSTASGTAVKPKTAIVMLNMGGPETTDQVGDYLHRIMTDRDMIQLPVQSKLGPWIASRRTEEVKKKYSEIGGGSPILKWTNSQGSLLTQALDQMLPESAPHKHYVAFRYVPPFTEDAFREVERTTPANVKFSLIERWASHKLLAKVFSERIKEKLDKFDEKIRDDVLILFTAHSLPLKAVSRGDTYPHEVASTVSRTMEELGGRNPHRLVWQSKVGPLPWLQPYTDDAIKLYAKQGVKHLILVPVAFVNEHIETLHELDIEYCDEVAKEAGILQIERAEAPNVHPTFIAALADVVAGHISNGPRISKQFLTRCPHCVSQRCLASKEFFKRLCGADQNVDKIGS